MAGLRRPDPLGDFTALPISGWHNGETQGRGTEDGWGERERERNEEGGSLRERGWKTYPTP